MNEGSPTALPTPGRRKAGWRGRARRAFPRAVRLADRIGDPLVGWAERRLPDEAFLRRQFAAHLGFPLDLEDPKLLVEKIQWLKLHDVTPLHRRCSDKIAVRDHVREVVGEEVLIPLLDVMATEAGLTPARIAARRFVAKTNHDCGGVVLCPDREAFDWAAARAKLGRHRRRDYWRAQRELAYRGIEPHVLVEEMLPGPDGGPPEDYKFFCFGGEAVMIQVIAGRGGAQTRTMMAPDWTVLPVRRRGVPSASVPPPRPPRLGEMLRVAAALSAPFRFCRVDLYAVGEAIYFGEYAFYPDGGYRPFEPVVWEERLGALVRL